MKRKASGKTALSDGGVTSASGSLRADAARNVISLRKAALNAFRGHGLNFPLANIAAAAGVSKGTLYHRFGGRSGLIESVIEELVATELYAAIASARAVDDPWQQLVAWTAFRRDLQYREPAFTDVMLMTYPASKSRYLATLAKNVSQMTAEVVQSGHRSGLLRRDVTPGDLFWADIANGLALRELPKPRRDDYDRRTRMFLDGLRSTEPA